MLLFRRRPRVGRRPARAEKVTCPYFSLAASVGDISAEGMFVTLDRGALAALKADSKVDVEVTFDGDTMLLHGVMRSEHAGGYGIHFPPFPCSPGANVPPKK
jgi:hypothetical protein